MTNAKQILDECSRHIDNAFDALSDLLLDPELSESEFAMFFEKADLLNMIMGDLLFCKLAIKRLTKELQQLEAKQ